LDKFGLNEFEKFEPLKKVADRLKIKVGLFFI